MAICGINWLFCSRNCFVFSGTSDVLEHKWQASLKQHYCYTFDFNI